MIQIAACRNLHTTRVYPSTIFFPQLELGGREPPRPKLHVCPGRGVRRYPHGSLNACKALLQMLVTDASMATRANELHLVKAFSSILVTDAGMATLVNALHPPQVKCSMLVTNDVHGGMSTLVNELQSQRAQSPMLITDAGRATLVNVLHPKKSFSSILVTDVGINVTLVTPPPSSCSLPILVRAVSPPIHIWFE